MRVEQYIKNYSMSKNDIVLLSADTKVVQKGGINGIFIKQKHIDRRI